jgi:sulfate/thiosulfate transport system substrate-binding protein
MKIGINKSRTSLMSIALVVGLTLTACGQSTDTSSKSDGTRNKDASSSQQTDTKPVKLILGSYSTTKGVFSKIIPEFQKYWKDKTGQDVTFEQSYDASSAEARTIVHGLEADVVALSLEGDINTLKKAGLITHDWKTGEYGGMVTRSVVALGTRKGNPKNIKDWTDLTKPGVEVLYPNPKTSGGAQWDIDAIYGAGLKMSEEKGKKDPKFAQDLLTSIQKHVKVMDKSGAASMTTFQSGVGDVVVTYENELIAANQKSVQYDIVDPKYTILIENPVAVVDKNVDKHGTRKVAEAFVQFLLGVQAQKDFADAGFRPVDPNVLKQYQSQYHTPAGLFDVNYLGGSEKSTKDLYGQGGVFDQVLAAAAK